MKFDDLKKDFEIDYCQNAKFILEKNLEIAVANVQTFSEVQAEILCLCNTNYWDEVVELIQELMEAQPEDAKFLVDEEEYYLKPVRERNIEKVTKMLEEVDAKLQTEVRVARYEVDARYQDLQDEVHVFMNELNDIRDRKKIEATKEEREEQKKTEEE